MDEEDPVECRALESSLWEIKVCTACDRFGFSNESSMAPTTTVTHVSQGFCHVDFENELKEYHTLYGAALFFFSSILQTLQKHHHPDVAKAAMMINKPLPEQEDDISEVLEITTYEVM